MGAARTQITLTDDDAMPTLSVADVSVTEGHSGSTPATFTVTLSVASGRAVRVTYGTTNGTATAGADYTAAAGTATIPSGQLTTTIPVTVLGDTLTEPWEHFTLTLSAPVAATLARASAVGTIQDDDVDAVRLVIGTGVATPPHAAMTFVRADVTYGYVETARFQLPFQTYVETGGEIRPAVGDVDGDGYDEIVVGLGPGGGGWLAVFDDARTNHALLGWVRVAFDAYNAANGETFPAVGDLDGDGKAEIVVGLGPGGGGWLQVFSDATLGFAPRQWVRVEASFQAYNDANGSTHPAIGNIDADPLPELVVGLGQGSDGWLEVFDVFPTQMIHLRWLRPNWPDYNAANGTTWPALGNLDADPQAELVIGFGVGGGGWLATYQDPVEGSSFAQWVRLDWPAYNDAVGELHPAIGNLDSDPTGEIVVGLGRYPTPVDSGGWLRVLDDWTPGFGVTFRDWIRIGHRPLEQEGVGTWPAIGRLR